MMVSSQAEVAGLVVGSATNAVQIRDFDVDRIRAEPLGSDPATRSTSTARPAAAVVPKRTVAPAASVTAVVVALLIGAPPPAAKTSTPTTCDDVEVEVHE